MSPGSAREPLRDKLPRSAWVWSGLFLLFAAFALLLGPPLLLLRAIGVDRDRKLAARLTAAGFRGFLVWCSGIGLARLRGIERAGAGPFVVVANHESNLDICLVLAFSPRPARLVAKGELRRVPIVGLAVDSSGSIFTRDETAEAGSDGPLADAIDAVRAGASVIFFPEGTRSRGRGVRRFRKGAFEVARATGTPVLPLVLVGSGEFMPAGGVLPLGPYRITVEALAPRRVEGEPAAFARALRDEVARARARILAEPFHEPTRREQEIVPTGPLALES